MSSQTMVLEMTQPAQDMAMKYNNALNEMIALNVDTAFDILNKNVSLAMGMRHSVDALVDDMLKGQQRFLTEMMQITQAYAARMPDMLMLPTAK